MAEPLLEVTGLIKSFGGLVAIDSVSLDVTSDEVHAVIGPNGAGKTTFIAQISGDLRPDSGTIRFAGADITRLATPKRAQRGLARSFQITSIFRDVTAEDNVALAVQAHDGHSFRFWRAAKADPSLRDPARAALDRVGLGDRRDVVAGELAHGEQRQLELAMAIATEPAMLLLDEPMAGMGAEESERMVALLQELKGSAAILLVEHDMDAVFALADRITVLVRGQAIATGSPQEIRDDDQVRRAYLGEDG
ncbi:MAG: ATP-binding cassette domain-containing protein [Alphaproteobacteria bacterium]|nr:ATP-binding cassette domain-containing protein [Alphaproteobacteria bacterium]